MPEGLAFVQKAHFARMTQEGACRVDLVTSVYHMGTLLASRASFFLPAPVDQLSPHSLLPSLIDFWSKSRISCARRTGELGAPSFPLEAAHCHLFIKVDVSLFPARGLAVMSPLPRNG